MAGPAGPTRRPVDELGDELSEIIGADIDESLLLRALTHRSYSYENGGAPHNERLEFLGDSVLGLVVTDTLFTTHPDHTEGQLAKFRAAVVNMRALAEVATTLGLGGFVLLGRGEESTGGREKTSILADTTEAVIGAAYLSAGLDGASRLVHYLLDPMLKATASLGAGLDWKTSLQEISAELGLGSPEYHLTEDGPEHEKTFTAEAFVGGEVYGHGVGRTKKDAEQQAASTAWKVLNARATDAGASGTAGAARVTED